MEQAIERARKIRAILTDVDGILTDGKVNFFVRDDGKIDEFKSFNTQDGIALMLCRGAGIICGIIMTIAANLQQQGIQYMSLKRKAVVLRRFAILVNLQKLFPNMAPQNFRLERITILRWLLLRRRMEIHL